ncbi:DNA replication/repair protein RecF [Pyrinomonas methylaliphatogenes]|uniref:DNA replication and repair protein RecF n=1 Tax=Pyrinomonas methylaliphatogenes TaxID=454194 RepID=A0A0B6X1A6_9BACT|nr:DNA replication/repair protein RecF [Pyrinomonas methylaliphatogenes]MBX5479776.1 DNA replication/repair protein RecF [Pyrinomonas methylaliphatogenes]CDM66782.1 DNA replication and repair protein RecF [Pyrinomonas methylaliphatogenes]
MLLESLEVHQFRNLSGKVFWHSNLNIIYGDNGQGKTNWLEAIYLLATSKSFRTSRPQETIRFGANLAFVRGRVRQSEAVSRDLQVTLQGNSKLLFVNGKKEQTSAYLGQLQVIAFTADELEVVRGAPEARRRFLDRGVLALHHAYIQTLADYNQVLRQKNRLLQEVAEGRLAVERARELLLPWNEQLAELGTEIHCARIDYVKRLNAVFEKKLFGREEVTIRYLSSLEGKGDLSDYRLLLTERLNLRLPAEIAAGCALVGPHRDDLEILFDGRDIRAYGSAGQQRSALILLDLAALSVYHSWCGEYPLFLIDDIDAELDRKRIGHLLEYLEGRTQTFITTSKADLIRGYSSDQQVALYEVKEGLIVPSSSEGVRAASQMEGVFRSLS